MTNPQQYLHNFIYASTIKLSRTFTYNEVRYVGAPLYSFVKTL